jgi:antitoxin component YwqK of YwqJK toxin-antitoxin module
MLLARILLLLAASGPLPVAAVSTDSPGCSSVDHAVVSGPPARELFDPHTPQAGEASWCERYDERGRAQRHGPYTDRYPSGALRAQASFVDDRLDGVVRILHENGQLWLYSEFRSGTRTGAHAIYSPDGAPWLTTHYRDDQLDGEHATWYENGRRSAETHYRSGVENGTSRAWYPDGTLRREIEVRDDVWNGRFARWHPNGQLSSLGRYAPCPNDSDGPGCSHLGAARHGTWETHYSNGIRESRGQWSYGRKVGTWVHWNTRGEPERMLVYEQGQLVRIAKPQTDDEPAAPAPTR